MKIKEFILQAEIKNYSFRLDKLIEYRAPVVMIEGQRKLVEELKKGKLNIKGDIEVLGKEFLSYEKKTGRGGKFYIQFNCNDGKVNYFPAARYGRYIKKLF